MSLTDEQIAAVLEGVWHHLGEILPELSREDIAILVEPYSNPREVCVRVFFWLTEVTLAWHVGSPYGPYNLIDDLANGFAELQCKRGNTQLRALTGAEMRRLATENAKLRAKIAKLQHSPNPGKYYLAAMANFDSLKQ